MKERIDMDRLPKHIAIIMDGNGRWAKQKNLSRSQGHLEGAKRVEEIVDTAQELGIKALTLFTFSSENWNRPNNEVSLLMEMLKVVLKTKLKKLKKNNIRFQTIGRKEKIPSLLLDTINQAIEDTKNNDDMVMNLAFNYGSRQEIVDAVKNISLAVKDNKYTIDDINEKLISDNLYTYNLPDPDLLIRTSGEQRISNFLLWQLSYAEFYFTDKYWPDFDKEEFYKAIVDYQERNRRFGGVDAQGEKIEQR